MSESPTEFFESVIDDVDERREELIRAHEELDREKIIRVENMDTGEYDYTPVRVAQPPILESALTEECKQATVIDEVQYMAEDV
ncbi:hypothetical protein GCM10009000_104450 [Halobacterium noricense]